MNRAAERSRALRPGDRVYRWVWTGSSRGCDAYDLAPVTVVRINRKTVTVKTSMATFRVNQTELQYHGGSEWMFVGDDPLREAAKFLQNVCRRYLADKAGDFEIDEAIKVWTEAKAKSKERP